MTIGSQYVRGAKVVAKRPPLYSGLVSLAPGFTNPTLVESVDLTPDAVPSETISESVQVTSP